MTVGLPTVGPQSNEASIRGRVCNLQPGDGDPETEVKSSRIVALASESRGEKMTMMMAVMTGLRTESSVI